MSDKDDNDILISLVGMNIKHPEQKLESHPDPEALAAFVDNPLPNKNATLKSLDEIKQHLNSCPDCYQQWFELKRQMLALQAVKQPWYVRLLSFKFGLNPLQFNIASGAVAASLVVVLVNLVVNINQPPVAIDTVVIDSQNVTFKLPSKLSAVSEYLDNYCNDCTVEDYELYVKELSIKLKEECSNPASELNKDSAKVINSAIQRLIEIHPDKNNSVLNKLLSECKSTFSWSE